MLILADNTIRHGYASIFAVATCTVFFSASLFLS